MPRNAAATILVFVLLGWAAASAEAASVWGSTRVLPSRYIDIDLPEAPPLALNAKGQALTIWASDHGFALARGSATSTFREVRIPGSWSPETIAVAPDGRGLVVLDDDYNDRYGYHAVVSTTGKLGPIRRFAQNIESVVAQPDGSFIMLGTPRDSSLVLGARTLSKGGKVGARTALGKVRDGLVEQVASTPSGHIIVCCGSGKAPAIFTYTPGRGWKTSRLRLRSGESVDSVSTAGGRFLVTTVRTGPVTVLREIRDGVARVRGMLDGGATVALDGRGRPVGAEIKSFSLLGIPFDDAWVAGTPVDLGPGDEDFFRGARIVPWRDGAIIASSDERRWSVGLAQDGRIAKSPAPANGSFAQSGFGVPAHISLVGAGRAAGVSWYDNNHNAHVAITRP